MQVSVYFARFPFGQIEHPDVTDWIIETSIKCKLNPKISRAETKPFDDTPITMSRNLAVEAAKQKGADYLVMIDNDMAPDLKISGAKPFWDSSLEFMMDHRGPCIIGAPYCGKPPMSCVFVFQWCAWQNDSPDPDIRLEMYTREQAAEMAGIQRVGALPTGLIMIDMRIFEKMKPPYFYYEWKDERACEKASTEDVTFTRDVNMLGYPIYCNWDAWAGHWKKTRVDKPKLIYSETVQQKYREAVLADHRQNERLIVLGEGDDNHRNGPLRSPLRVE